MFYRPAEGHGLPHSPFAAIVSPRPIGWISTRSGMGDNLAPYSFFNAVAYHPPQIMFSGDVRDSMENALESGVFAVNVVQASALHNMNATSARFPRGTDEFVAADVAKAECVAIDCPRVADAPATLECRVVKLVDLLGDERMLVGEVVGIHIRDDCLIDGRFDVTRYNPAARLGYHDYTFVREVTALRRP
ncbi:flavin reductase family protein [Tabrizicola sp.]|uniref:flavin reductase family protein n=1 Tax=Tabrizicola sp. TaxID=2005166 RepID=UPI002624C2D5|nr:flavin reductase family protein [Tabrizicola sp.]MDM7932358.1 flavin reductase family protein [Tabrizicola sp.]